MGKALAIAPVWAQSRGDFAAKSCPKVCIQTFDSTSFLRRFGLRSGTNFPTRLRSTDTMAAAFGQASSPAPASSREREGYSVNALAAKIQKRIQEQVNGQLVLQAADGTTWNLYFRVGRLFWASGGKHACRRWRRLLRQYGRLNAETLQIRDREKSPVPEHRLLNILIKRQKISRQDASTLIEQNILDILFDILQASTQIRQISAVGDALATQEEPIAILSTAELVRQAQELLKGWFNLGLMVYSPDLAPRILDPEALKTQVSPKLAQALSGLATGKASIRELAIITRQTPLALGNLLGPPAQKNLLEFIEIPDIPNPYNKNKAIAENDSGSARAVKLLKDAPTILCVDDSAQIAYILEQILQPAGYRFVSVQESVEALSAILKHKPDLIFLDLLMPLVYGNEICTQLRRAPSFRDTPVIMLSSNARMLDRIQAKGAGATDFMAKPLEPAKVLTMVRRYLGELPALSAEMA